ncbi:MULTISPECIES: MFS transporter [Streptomyces]|uniref:MFS transporter n=1 Tax=Streptomyces TaxID=1883 RepID=UPI002E25D55F
MSSTSPLSTSTSPVTPSGTVLIRSAADVSDLVNSGTARGRHAKMIVVIALGGIFLDAYDLSPLAYGLPDITKQFGLSSTMAGTVTASISVGSLLGALVGGWLMDRIGRYRLHSQCSGVYAGGEASHVVAARSGAVLWAAERTNA